MHFRLRSCEDVPSGLQIFTVLADQTEEFHPTAQELWEDALPFEHPVHLKVLRHRIVETILVVEFIEFGYSCVFQENKGVAQWCIELAEDHTCPDDLMNSLRRHPFLSDQLLEVDGNRYNQVLKLTELPEVMVPQWARESTADTAHEVNIYFNGITGPLGTVRGFVALMVSLDAHLSELFLSVCGLQSPYMFLLKRISSRRQGASTEYNYEAVCRRRRLVRAEEWSIDHVIWMVALPFPGVNGHVPIKHC